jgi:pilus assembly protein CpaC
VKTKWLFKIRIFFLAALILSAQTTYTQKAAAANDDAAEEVDQLSKDPIDKSFNKEIKYISLFIGIEAQEKISSIPADARPFGDYSKVAKVTIDRDAGILNFSPKKIGVATLTIRSGAHIIQEFRLDVKKSDLTKVAKDIQVLLKDIDGITIKIVNNRVVVDGQVLLPKEINRIHSVLKQFEGQTASLVILSPIAERKIAQMIESDINLANVHVRTVNGKFLLEGEVDDQGKKDFCMTIAQTYIPDLVPLEAQKDGVTLAARTVPVINLITIKAAAEKPTPKILQIVVHFVELNKSYLKDFGFSWAPGFQDNSGLGFSLSNSQQGGVTSAITGTISNLLPRLNWSKSHGHSRVLDSAEILIQDGQKGTLDRHTDYPYTELGPTGAQSVKFQKVGITMSIAPKLANARSDNISLDLKFNMGQLIGTAGGSALVSISEVDTVINIRSGQSAAIGGLISNKTGTDYNRAPAGSTNPIFTLNASKAFRHDQSQFVVFVTPIIKTSASQGAEKVKQKFRLRD